MSERRMWPTPQAYDAMNSHAPRLKKDRQTRDPLTKGSYRADLKDVVLFPPPDRAEAVSPQLTLFAEAFPVSPTPWLVDEAALPTSATSGPSSADSFASCNPDGSWRKTCQGFSQLTLDGSLARFSETWPRAGMTRSGIAYRLPPLAPLTDGTASGSWPTPQAQMAKHGGATVREIREELQHHRRINLHVAVALYPTPTSEGYDATENHGRPSLLSLARTVPTPKARDYRTGDRAESRRARAKRTGQWHSPDLNDVIAPGGQLNPTWVEWLMGYPQNWTEL